MKMNEFLKGKKLSIISGVAFFAIFVVISAVFSYGMDSKFNRLKAQIDQMSSSVSSLETSSSSAKSSIDGMIQVIDGVTRMIDEMAQKPDISTADQSANTELQSKLDDILKYLPELEKKVASLKIGVEAGNQTTKSEEETITVPDTKVPEGPANTANPDTVNAVKVGQDFIVTIMANEVSNLFGYQFNLNYDNKKANYKGSLKSTVSGISTIFKKDMSDHLLVGATMIGNMPGYSGKNVTVCTMVFTANENFDPSSFTINDVSTVDENQKYIENISGWSIEAKAE